MAVDRLLELLDVEARECHVEIESPLPGGAGRPDAIIHAAGRTLVLEYKGSGTTAAVAAGLEQARRYASILGPSVIPVLAVPFMGEAGRQRSADAGVAWLDLSGNARIVAPGLRVVVEGRPNLYKRRGRPSSVFAPKSSRIARWLLMHPAQSTTQRDLARATGMDEGFTSRIVSRLEEDRLLVRNADGSIRPRDPDVLLEAWYEAYDFSKHRILRGHVAARDGSTLLTRLANGLGPNQAPVATGLAGAWLLTHFAGFRLVTLYVSKTPDPDAVHQLGFREVESGANVWLVVPNDEGVLQGSSDREGVRCVHPVQVYLDLKAQPERAAEAASEIRAKLLSWSKRA